MTISFSAPRRPRDLDPKTRMSSNIVERCPASSLQNSFTTQAQSEISAPSPPNKTQAKSKISTPSPSKCFQNPPKSKMSAPSPPKIFPEPNQIKSTKILPKPKQDQRFHQPQAHQESFQNLSKTKDFSPRPFQILSKHDCASVLDASWRWQHVKASSHENGS